MITVLIAAAMIGQAPQPDPPAKADAKPAAAKGRTRKAVARNVEVFIEPNWVPTPGDRVEVIVDGVLGSVDMDAFPEALSVIQAGDRAGIDELIKSKRAGWLAKGTKVLVIASSRPPKVVQPARVGSPQELHQMMLTNGGIPPSDFSKFPVEVRILAGPLAGEKRFVPEMWLANVIKDPMAPSRRPKPRLNQQAAKPGNAKTNRAAVLLRSARNLEKSGKPDGAAKFYRDIVKDFPDSPEATTAAGRLRSLERK